MQDLSEPTFTFKVTPGAIEEFDVGALIYGESVLEDRARTVVGRMTDAGVTTHCASLANEAILTLEPWIEGFNLYEQSALDELVSRIPSPIAVDLTSLEHRVWAPLVRTILASGKRLLALYVEPHDYRKHDEEPGSLFDLSSTRGIEPLPGFARITRRGDGIGAFAPLLGFEGARLKHIFDQEDVDSRQTAPIVGVPGFRLEYSMYSYVANRDTLDQDRMEDRTELAAANCPFEAYGALERIHQRVGQNHLRVAPIGTKPHALGAVLYAIRNPTNVELIYDHPVRTENRTEGSRSVYVYDVSGFLDTRPVERA